MHLLNYPDVPEDNVSQTFKNAAWRGLLWVAVIMAVITAYTAIPKGAPTNPVLIAIPAAMTLLAILLLLWRLRQALNRRNWLVKAAPEGLYINLQPNTAVPPAAGAPEVLFVPRETIANITRVQERRKLPDRSGQYRNNFSYFDLALAEPVPDALVVGLAQIRRNPAIKGSTGHKRDLHMPVRVVGRHSIRLVWDWMTPRELDAARWFEAHYSTEPLKKIEEPGWEKMSEEDRGRYIDTLWEWGDVQDAVHLISMIRKTSERKAANYLADRLG